METPNSAETSDSGLLSVIVPAYNEEQVLPEFHSRLSTVLAGIGLEAEIIYVNDGSRDNTLEILRRLRSMDDHVTIIDLSRNFGNEVAMTAGFDHALGDAVIVIDADLQDPPELIPEMVRQWKAGYDMVYAQRTVREGGIGSQENNCVRFLSHHPVTDAGTNSRRYRRLSAAKQTSG